MKVLSGRYEGETGLIVRVEENRVVLFSDLTMHELEVLPRDLQLCSDMATGVDSLGQFQWGDLVQLESVSSLIISISLELLLKRCRLKNTVGPRLNFLNICGTHIIMF